MGAVVQLLIACVAAFAALGCAGSSNRAAPGPAPLSERAPPEPPGAPAEPAFRLSTKVVPLGYRLELTLDPSAPHYDGAVHIDVEVREPTDTLSLNGRGLQVVTAHAQVGNESLVARVTSRKGADPRAPDDELVLHLAQRVAGRVTLRLTFRAEYQGDLGGLYRVNSGGRDYVFSQFEPMDARRAFPCFDEPSFKVPLSLTIRAPRGQLAVANMPEIGRRELAEWTEFSFQTSPPLPTYLIALAVGPLEVRKWAGPAEAKPSVPVRLITTAGKTARGKLALDFAVRELALLEAYFGSRYPYPKLDVVAVPEFESGAMENAGLVTFREELLLVTESSSVENVRRLAEVMAHELAHMWFGDWVTLSWWDDLWLNEAFATWMESGIVQALEPEWQVEAAFLGRLSFAMSSDATLGARAIRGSVRTQSDALRAFSGITYAKGAAVLGMVEQWMGPDEFRAGLRRYLERHAHGNASSTDLFAALGQSQLPVRAVIDSFTTQTGIPEVTFQSRCDAATATLHLQLSQRSYQPLGSTSTAAAKTWQIPVCVRIPGTPKVTCTLLTRASGEMQVPVKACPATFIPNAGKHGYYHASIGSAALGALGALPPGSLDPREQVGLMLDARAALGAGALDMAAYLDLSAGFFAGAPRPLAAWEQFLDTAQFLAEEVLPKPRREQFERWLRQLINAELSRIGPARKRTEPVTVALLRSKLLSAGGLLAQDPVLLARAAQGARAWLADPTRLDGDEAAFALPVAGSTNDAKLTLDLLALVQATPVAEQRVLALRALGATSAPERVEQLLSLVREGQVKSQDLRYLLPPLAIRRDSRGQLRNWLERHFAGQVSKLPPFIFRRVVAAALEHCDPLESAAIRAAWETPMAGVEGADGLLAESYDRAAQCSAFKQKHAAGLEQHLSKK